jgi:hypothetical protein
MPTLREGAKGAVVRGLQKVLSNGASGQWNTSPGAIDGNFGPITKAAVQAGSPRTALLMIKRGLSHCTQQARRWKPPSVFNMRPDDRVPRTVLAVATLASCL